jgi:hypothetical protein
MGFIPPAHILDDQLKRHGDGDLNIRHGYYFQSLPIEIEGIAVAPTVISKR